MFWLKIRGFYFGTILLILTRSSKMFILLIFGLRKHFWPTLIHGCMTGSTITSSLGASGTNYNCRQDIGLDRLLVCSGKIIPIAIMLRHPYQLIICCSLLETVSLFLMYNFRWPHCNGTLGAGWPYGTLLAGSYLVERHLLRIGFLYACLFSLEAQLSPSNITYNSLPVRTFLLVETKGRCCLGGTVDRRKLEGKGFMNLLNNCFSGMF